MTFGEYPAEYALVKIFRRGYHPKMISNQASIALGLAISSLRRAKRLTQRELAERLHIHHSMVTRWEKGQTVPRDETLERIASALEVSVEELIATERKGPLRLPGLAEDQELVQLLSQLHSLEGRDIDALKVFLDAMLTKARIRQMVGSSVAVAQAS